MYSQKRTKINERTTKCAVIFCAVFSVLALLTITVFLFGSGAPFIARTGLGKFLFGTNWDITSSNPSYGILPMILSSIYLTALSLLIGVTTGLFTAIALYKFLPRKVVAPISQTINLLSGIPSVIFGLFGMTVIVPVVRDYISPNGVGYGLFSSAIVLSIMILPTIVSVTLDSLNSVPKEYYEGALALGATKEQATFLVMLPAGKSGVMAGVVLATGRAIGETMAVIMVIGGSTDMPVSLFQSVRTMTANIAMGAMEVSGDALYALIATGVVLFTFTLLINVCFALLKKEKKEKGKKAKK